MAPCRDYREEDKDFAIAAAIPPDAKGVTFITRPAPGPMNPMGYDAPISRDRGHVKSMIIFDDLFVPWEHGFLCPEWEFAKDWAITLANWHKFAMCSCKVALWDLCIGAAELISQYNGVSRASHVRKKIAELILQRELLNSCVVRACVDGIKHPSGVMVPNLEAICVGKHYIG